jgi:hypothetical protein
MKLFLPPSLARLLALACLIAGTACTHVMFDQPQPRQVPDEAQVPATLLGEYLLSGDTVRLAPDGYHTWDERHCVVPARPLPEHIRLEGDMLFDAAAPNPRWVPFEREGDSLHYAIRIPLHIGRDSLRIRTYAPGWAVSVLGAESQGYWDVFLLQPLQNGHWQLLSVGNLQEPGQDKSKINYDGKLKKFDRITPFKPLGESQYLVSPTAKEFDRLVKKGLFVPGDTLHRLP